MDSIGWFLLTAALAAISVGATLSSVSWGCSTLVVLLALRNAVAAGYFEGRMRFEFEKAVKPSPPTKGGR